MLAHAVASLRAERLDGQLLVVLVPRVRACVVTARTAFVDQLVTITLDPQRGLALIAGRANAQRAAFLLSRPGDSPRWSSSGRRYVVPYGVGLDATGWCQHACIPCRVVELGEPT